MHTRASAVRSFYEQAEAEMNAGWQSFMANEGQITQRSNVRLLAIIERIKGQHFVSHLNQYMSLMKAKGSRLRIVRQPTGIAVNERRFSQIPKVWIEQKECEDGKYAYVCIQIKPDRWVRLVVWY